MAPAAIGACHACGKSGCKLLRCGRCRSVRFCSRECQIVARKELGHRGANCRAADAAQTPSTSAAPSQPITPMDVAELARRYEGLIAESQKLFLTNTRIGYLASADNYREAASVADLIGGADGVERRAKADQRLSKAYVNLGELAAAARAICSSLRAARESGSRTRLVSVLTSCGELARHAPGEMASAERQSREQERCSGSPLHGGLDLSQEGRISLPTTPAALSRLGLAYNEAAIEICDAALAATGGRGSPAADDRWRVPSLPVEATARGSLGSFLHTLGEQQRGLELLRQAVALRRQSMRMTPGDVTLDAQRKLTDDLSLLGDVLKLYDGSDGIAEAEACLREALALGEGLGYVWMSMNALRFLINLCGNEHAAVRPAEAEAFSLELNQLLVQMGRSPETSCSICLEPLAPPADGAASDAAGGGGSGGVGGPADSCLRVMSCNHQFHHGCLLTWRRLNPACPLCKE